MEMALVLPPHPVKRVDVDLPLAETQGMRDEIQALRGAARTERYKATKHAAKVKELQRAVDGMENTVQRLELENLALRQDLALRKDEADRREQEGNSLLRLASRSKFGTVDAGALARRLRERTRAVEELAVDKARLEHRLEEAMDKLAAANRNLIAQQHSSLAGAGGSGSGSGPSPAGSSNGNSSAGGRTGTAATGGGGGAQYQYRTRTGWRSGGAGGAGGGGFLDLEEELRALREQVVALEEGKAAAEAAAEEAAAAGAAAVAGAERKANAQRAEEGWAEMREETESKSTTLAAGRERAERAEAEADDLRQQQAAMQLMSRRTKEEVERLEAQVAAARGELAAAMKEKEDEKAAAVGRLKRAMERMSVSARDDRGAREEAEKALEAHRAAAEEARAEAAAAGEARADAQDAAAKALERAEAAELRATEAEAAAAEATRTVESAVEAHRSALEEEMRVATDAEVAEARGRAEQAVRAEHAEATAAIEARRAETREEQAEARKAIEEEKKALKDVRENHRFELGAAVATREVLKKRVSELEDRIVKQKRRDKEEEEEEEEEQGGSSISRSRVSSSNGGGGGGGGGGGKPEEPPPPASVDQAEDREERDYDDGDYKLSSPGGEGGGRVRGLSVAMRQQLMVFFECAEDDAAGMAKIDALLRDYVGREDVLFLELTAKEARRKTRLTNIVSGFRVSTFADQLSKCAAFAEVSRPALLELVTKAPTLAFEPGETLVAEGQPLAGCYVILEGSVIFSGLEARQEGRQLEAGNDDDEEGVEEEEEGEASAAARLRGLAGDFFGEETLGTFFSDGNRRISVSTESKRRRARSSPTTASYAGDGGSGSSGGKSGGDAAEEQGGGTEGKGDDGEHPSRLARFSVTCDGACKTLLITAALYQELNDRHDNVFEEPLSPLPNRARLVEKPHLVRQLSWNS
eukprot:g2797.t1